MAGQVFKPTGTLSAISKKSNDRVMNWKHYGSATSVVWLRNRPANGWGCHGERYNGYSPQAEKNNLAINHREWHLFLK